MPAPMTAAIPWALDVSEGYVLRFTAVDPTTGATVSGVTVSGATVEGQSVTGAVPGPEGEDPFPLLVPAENAA